MRAQTAVPAANTQSRAPLQPQWLSPARLLGALTATLTALAPALVLMLTLTASTQAQAQTIANICDRTAQVETALLATSEVTTGDCTMVTEEMLGAITTLTISSQTPALTALAAGDLDDLTALTSLDLSGNSITALTAGIFTGLTALTTLNLSRTTS